MEVINTSYQTLNHSSPSLASYCWICVKPGPIQYIGVILNQSFVQSPGKGADLPFLPPVSLYGDSSFPIKNSGQICAPHGMALILPVMREFTPAQPLVINPASLLASYQTFYPFWKLCPSCMEAPKMPAVIPSGSCALCSGFTGSVRSSPGCHRAPGITGSIPRSSKTAH
jgi:hypothetical protein